jgi:hypothetical protein
MVAVGKAVKLDVVILASTTHSMKILSINRTLRRIRSLLIHNPLLLRT